MADQRNSPSEDKQPGSDSPSAKKPYRSARLTVYGDLRLITMAKGGIKSDGGGPPKTKL